MVKVILRQEAIDDLKNIWDYTFEKWSEMQADKQYVMLKHSCAEIGKNPEIGKEHDGINKKFTWITFRKTYNILSSYR